MNAKQRNASTSGAHLLVYFARLCVFLTFSVFLTSSGPFPRGFAFLHFSCFLAPKSHPSFYEKREKRENTHPPKSHPYMRNAKQHMFSCFSCFVFIGAEIARTEGQASKTPSSDLVRVACSHHCTLEKQPFS
jgi:hypothetical protein